MHVTVEVGYQHHGVLCRKPFQDGFGDGGDVFDHPVVTGIQNGILGCNGNAFGLQGLAEGIIGADNGVAAKGALGMDVGIPEQSLGYTGQKGVGITELFKPVDAVGVYGSAKVYEYSINHPCNQFS